MLVLLLLVPVVVFLTLMGGFHNIPALIALVMVEVGAFPGVWLISQSHPPFVPTSRRTVRDMLTLARIRTGEVAYDIGCGDGRLVFAAATAGAQAIGYEFSIPTYLLARFCSIFSPGGTIRYGNFWKRQYRDADVIFCYLLPETMARFKREIWPTLKPGCRIVTNVFLLKDLPYREKCGKAYLYAKE